MKKFRKLVIGGIESKIVTLILIAMILVAGVFFVATAMQSRMLSDLAEETSGRQQSAVTSATADIVNQVIDESMSRTAELEAEVTDELFRDLVSAVRMMGEYAGKLFDDPDANPRAAWQRPDASNDGTISAQMIFAEGVEESEVSDRLGLIANMSDMMLSLCRAYGIEGAYIGIKEGVMLSVNTAAGEWVREDGSYVSFDPRERYWYRQAAEAGELVLTDAETDHATGEMCVTCAMPIYVNNELAAVVGSDLFLTSMRDSIQASEENGGFLCVINGNGHVVFSPKTEGPFQVLDVSNADDLRKNRNPELAAIVKDAMSGQTGVRLVEVDGEKYYMAGAPMTTVGWAMLSVFDKEAVDEPANMMRQGYQKIQSERKSYGLLYERYKCL